MQRDIFNANLFIHNYDDNSLWNVYKHLFTMKHVQNTYRYYMCINRLLKKKNVYLYHYSKVGNEIIKGPDFHNRIL